MARNQVSVEPRPDERWAVQSDGAERADSLHYRKDDAIKRARLPRRMPNAPTPASNSISSASPAPSSVGIANRTKVTVTVQGEVIGPVVYTLPVPGVPPQPEINAMLRPGFGVTVQVVVLPGTTGLAQSIVPPSLAAPVTATAKVAVTVQSAVTAPEA